MARVWNDIPELHIASKYTCKCQRNFLKMGQKHSMLNKNEFQVNAFKTLRNFDLPLSKYPSIKYCIHHNNKNFDRCNYRPLGLVINEIKVNKQTNTHTLCKMGFKSKTVLAFEIKDANF